MKAFEVVVVPMVVVLRCWKVALLAIVAVVVVGIVYDHETVVQVFCQVTMTVLHFEVPFQMLWWME